MSYLFGSFGDDAPPPLDSSAGGGSSGGGGTPTWQTGLTNLVSSLTQGAVQGGGSALTQLLPGGRPQQPPPAPASPFGPYLIPGLLVAGIGGAAILTVVKKKRKAA